jgi:hypothetical protein
LAVVVNTAHWETKGYRERIGTTALVVAVVKQGHRGFAHN